MPGFDRTGPSGLGQRTGRGMGDPAEGVLAAAAADLAGSLTLEHIRQALRSRVN